MPEVRIRDLVELPPVRTVVQLADLENPELASSILEDFVLTADSDLALSTLLESMAARKGQGFFLQGNFGSGKSHLLAVLDLLLRSNKAWDAIVRQDPQYRRLGRQTSPSAGANVVASVSLVEHTGSSSLEDICLTALESAFSTPLGLAPSFAADTGAVEEIRAALESRHRAALAAFLEENSVDVSQLFDASRPALLDELVRKLGLPFRVRRDRAGFFDALEAHVGAGWVRRAVLILDELSEFLRSKPDARAFSEDIRFLQFLGEASCRIPFWIVASLQEHIETTGEIDQTTFGKIKDRFPVRLSLTGRHLRELAGTRLIKKKPDAEAMIAHIYRRFKNAFTSLEVSETDFITLYPVHPATIELLDDLLPLFSRHRGAVDFLHHQLAGHRERHIEGMLDQPADNLLGPEAIFDHFRVRIHETLETAPYVSVVLAFYEKELPRIFPDTEDGETALRLLKILILGAISPIRRRRTVAQLAEMVLYRVTELDPAANYDFIRDLLESMRQRGAYISVESGEHPHQDVYFVDLAADVPLIIQRRVEGLLKDPGFTLGRALDMVLPSFISTLLPLASFAAAPRSTRRISWQKTRREGILIFARGEDDTLLTDSSLDEVHEKLTSTEQDFCVILLASLAEGAEPAGLLARLKDRGPGPYLVWVPRPLGNEAVAMIRRAAARLSVREHFRTEASEVGKRVIASLEPLIQEDKELAESIVQRAFREGKFLSPLGSPERSPADLPSLPFDRILERVAELALERRYPRHYLIAPTLELPAMESIQEMVHRFFRGGEVEMRDVSDTLRDTLEAHLRPLGLVKRTATGYRLQADPKQSELVRFIVDRIGAARIDFDSLYRELRKGPFGIDRPHFELTVLALVFSGQLTAFSKGRKMSLESLDARSLARVDKLGPGEMLSPELQAVLAGLPIVPPRFRQGTFGFPQQRELWEHVLAWKAETGEKVSDLHVELERAHSYRSAAHLDLPKISEKLERLRKLLDAVKTSYPAREGLEKLALACREEANATGVLEDFETLSTFFAEKWQRYLFIQKYLADTALDFPDRFGRLVSGRDRLREMASSPDAPLVPDLVRRLREEFQKFLSEYGQVYEEEHSRQKSPQRIKALTELRDGPSYRLLQRLADTRLISVDDDRVKIDRLIEGAAARTCARLSPEDLRSKPTCECGFRLGDRLDFPSTAEIQAAIERGIRQYLSALRDARYREKLESSLFGLTEVGKKTLADKTRQLLEVDLEAPDVLKRADKLVGRELVGVVNDALAGDFVLVDRAVEDLADRLVERSFPKAKLMDLVEHWIDGESRLGADDYVRIVSRSSGQAQVENRLRDFIASRYPELSPRWEQLGENAFLREACSALREEGAAGEDPEAGLRSLLEEALTAFVRDRPDDGVEVLDAAERLLSAEEREDISSKIRSEDDPKALLDQVFRERVFRFVVREAGGKLLRMLLTQSPAAKLEAGLKKVTRADMPAPLVERLGTETLAGALDHGIWIRNTTKYLQDVPARTLDASPAWEKLFRDRLGLVDLAMSRLEEASKALGIDIKVDLGSLVDALQQEVARLGGDFERFYLDQLPSEGEKGREPARMEQLFDALGRKYRRKLNPTQVRFVLLDGMRWDVWHHLKTNLLANLTATYRIVDEVLLWSFYPTTTKVQLDRAGLALPEDMLRAAEPPRHYRTSRRSDRGEPDRPLPGFQFLRGPDGLLVERLNLIDDKVHESKSDLMSLMREIELHCRRTLAVLLEEAPRGCLVFLFSDHGFRENLRWKAGKKKREARYFHGGASPWEVLTPLVALYRT